MNNRKQMYRQLLIAALTGLAFQPVSVSLYAYPAKASSHLAQADTTKVSEDEYTKLVKDDHSEKVGMFTVRHIKDDWYFEVPDSLLKRHILAVTRFKAVPQGFNLLSGEEVNHCVIYLEQHDTKTLFLREYVQTQFAEDKDHISQSLKESTVDPIISKFTVIGRNPKTHAQLIKVTSFFLEDNQVCGFTTNDKKILNVNSIQKDYCFMDTVKTYPINTEVQTLRTYAVSSGKYPAAQSGKVTLKLNTSMVLLPKTPMRPRLADNRVGYFQNAFTIFSDTQQKTEAESLIHRYRLEPKDPARYAKGLPTEPKHPIVYYIDPATPAKWIPYLKAGVEDWNIAFEAAGFKNAIIAKEWPNDSTMSLDDARFSVIRYLPSEKENAYGPRIVDPRSGEIIESHICWYHNVMNLLKKWYMVQCGPLDKRARTMNFDDELMGTLIRFVSSHEVGHSLGLRHNMIASSATPLENLRNKKWVEKNGHTVSIMDYARFNYVAQPEDHISPKGLFPRIGVYDKWAIDWGYRWHPEFKDPEDEKHALRTLVTQKLKADPSLFYVGDEGKGNDPRSQSEDLGDNNMKANEYGIQNLKRVMEHITEWTHQPDEQYDDLNTIYNAVRAQYIRYIGHVQKNIGRYYQGNLPGSRFKDWVPASRQKEAIEWFGRNLFEAPLWLYPQDVLEHISKVDPVTEIFDRQSSVISFLLAPGLLCNLHNASFVASEPYPVDKYLKDVFNAIWKPIESSPERVNYYTRQMERMYVSFLLNMLVPQSEESRKANTAFSRSDAKLYVESHLDDVESYLDAHLAQKEESLLNQRHFAALKREVEKFKQDYYKEKTNGSKN